MQYEFCENNKGPEPDKLLSMYCDICERPIGADCYPEHYNLGHSISSIQDAYQVALSKVHSFLSTKGHSHKEKLEGRISHRKRQIKELSRAQGRIQEEMDSSLEAILKRLELKLHPWISRLNKEKEDVEKDLQIYTHAMNLVKTSDKIHFLQEFKHTMNSLHEISNRQFYSETQFNLGEIPNELEDMRTQAGAYLELVHLNDMKNKVIWDISRGGSWHASSGFTREIVQWSRLTDQYLQKISAVAMRCYFCGVHLGPDTVNAPCKENQCSGLNQFLRDPSIPSKHIGSTWHYFVK